jgi:hypothetical protein
MRTEERDRRCEPADWAVWEKYAVRLPHASLPVMQELFARICEEIEDRRLDWRAARDGDTVGFKKPGGKTFMVALHCNPKGAREYKPPSMLIHPRAELVANPYESSRLQMFYVGEYGGVQGWSVPITGLIPDVAPVVELAITEGRD